LSAHRVKEAAPLKVAVVVPKFSRIGGAEAFAYETSNRLAAKSGIEIHIIANRFDTDPMPLIPHRIPHLGFPRALRPLFFAYMVERTVMKEGFDLIHSHDRIFSMDVLTMHGIPHLTWTKEVRRKRPSLFDKLQSFVESRGLSEQKPPIVLSVSSLVQEAVLRRYPHLKSSSRVLHPGADLERFLQCDSASARRDVRASRDIAPSDIVLLFVGMNFEIKRLDLVLRGVAEFFKQRPSGPVLKVLVVGKGDEGKYKRMASELGILKDVHFAGPRKDIERFYYAADIFAMPSSFDTFGIAVLEAMAAGLPPIISENVGARDILLQGESGIILPAHPDKEDLAEAIRITCKPEIRMKMGWKARSEAFTHSWDAVADEMEAVYLKAVKGARGDI